MNNRLVYSSGYDFSAMGLDKLHPFDAKKFSKAWLILENTIPTLNEYRLSPESPIDNATLENVHTPDYLQSLRESSAIAEVIELGLLRFLPVQLLARGLLDPIRLATAGTLLAAEYAVTTRATVMNLSGGYHHAFGNHGEGFCFFTDAALAIKLLRQTGTLLPSDKVAMIDLDAHRGNGFESFLLATAR